MNIKKTLLSCLIAATTVTTAHASEAHFKTGVYVGLAEGTSIGRPQFDTNYTPDSTVTGNPLSGTPQHGSIKKTRASFFGEITFGGRYLYENGFFPGFEVGISVGSQNFNHDFHFNEPDPFYLPAPGDYLVKASLKNKFSVTPSLVFGWVFAKQFNAFAKLGVNIARYKLDVAGLNYDPVFHSGSKEKTVISFAPQIGLEYSFSRHVSLFASLGAHIGGNVNLDKPGFFDLGVVFNDHLKLTGRNTTFTQKVGLLFKF
ncbi:MAG: hypothetical protein ACTHJ4_02005 [Candidatus Nucleicultricaceae bacterium]